MGEVVVTAQKRAERLQDVPISVSAFSAAQISQRGYSQLNDISNATPGLTFSNASPNRGDVVIRGIGSNRFDAHAEPSVGVFLDEIYVPRFTTQLGSLSDIERVEVLKGPQGTLYGRNTIGGAISVYTRDPTPHPDVEGSATFGERDLYGVNGVVSGPLAGDRVTGRLSVNYDTRTGFSRDTVSGRDNGGDNLTVRGKLAFKLTDDLKLVLGFTGFRTETNAYLFSPEGTPRFDQSARVVAVPTPDHYSDAYTIPGGVKRYGAIASARFNWSLPQFTFTSLTAFQNYRVSAISDLDWTAFDSARFGSTETSESTSQEFRLSSTPGGALTFGNRGRWIAGVYYLHDHTHELSPFTFGRDSFFSDLYGAFGVPQPLINASLPVSAYLNVAQDKDSTALFGQYSFDLTKKLTLTAGGRYSADKLYYTYGGMQSPRIIPGLPPLVADYTVRGEPGFYSFDPKGTIQYKITPDVQVYGSIGTGYKGGGLQSAVVTPALAERVFQPERSTAYEAGIKSQWFDRRLTANAAYYHTDYRNLQVQQVVVDPTVGPQAVTTNAAASTIDGVELNLVALPIAGVRLEASYNHLDTTFDRYLDPIAGQDFSGNRLPRSPENTYNLVAEYSRPVFAGWNMTLGADSFWTDSFYFFPTNDAARSQSAYNVANFRASFASPDGRYRVLAFLRNAFDSEYKTYVDNTVGSSTYDPATRRTVVNGYAATWSDKRTVGVTLAYRY